MWVHHEMGKCYLELKEFDLAKEVGERAVTLAGEVKDMTWYLNSSVLVAQVEGMYIHTYHAPSQASVYVVTVQQAINSLCMAVLPASRATHSLSLSLSIASTEVI